MVRRVIANGHEVASHGWEHIRATTQERAQFRDDVVRTKRLLERLPDPVRERVKPLSQRFPEDPADTKLSLGERFQNVIGVLNEVNKFNGEVSVTSEVRALANGSSAEVTALYLGIGQAYYVNASGDAAGIGTASADGWVWTPADEAGLRRGDVIVELNHTAIKDLGDFRDMMEGYERGRVLVVVLRGGRYFYTTIRE